MPGMSVQHDFVNRQCMPVQAMTSNLRQAMLREGSSLQQVDVLRRLAVSLLDHQLCIDPTRGLLRYLPPDWGQ